MKIYLETMGCQMNRLDSELVAGALRTAGHEMVDDPRAAGALLFNTCSVRRHAEQKVYSRLGAAAQRKSHRRRLIVGVLGCMAQREGEELRRKCPAVDIVCSPARLAELPEMIERAVKGMPTVALASSRSIRPAKSADAEELRIADCGLRIPQDGVQDSDSGNPQSTIHNPQSVDALDLSRDPSQTSSAFQAYVRVMHGCDKFCTYCIVPFVRGPEQCRPPGHIVEEVRRLVGAGRTEITLLGQTVNSYRWPGGGRTVSFADLLAMVSAVAGLRRLRFVTSHPNDFGDDVLTAMRDLPTICPYIHVPAQSGADAVLKRMGRRYTRVQYDDLIDRARAIVPGVVLAGDFIVGFPGETEADHAASADLIRRSGYKNSFIFKYSPRPGTAAARNFKDDVPADVKRRRNSELLAVQKEVGLTHHKAYIGQALEVLAEGPSPWAARRKGGSQLVGRTRGDHIVVFDAPPQIAGQYVSVEVIGATALTLLGRLT